MNTLMVRRLRFVGSLSLAAFAALPFASGGCSSDDKADADAGVPCSVEAQTGCEPGLVCEYVIGGNAADGGSPDGSTAAIGDGGAATGCFAPVHIDGKVTEGSETGPAVAGALVVARDVNGVATADVATTGPDGAYTIRVPAPRDSSGRPIEGMYTLRVDAQSFEPFPGALRVALPIDVRTAVAPDYVVKNAQTSVVLFRSSRTSATGIIKGTVQAPNPGGTLVVTEGSTAIADRSGAFTLFNVEPGGRTVRGYASGIQLDPASVEVPASTPAAGVVLKAASRPLATVSGSVNIVNAPGGSITSVVLAVEETFIDALERGEVPRGLRAGNVTGAFTINNVPDGKYVVLAAFENDGLVRDPDPGIAGTQIVRIEAKGGAITAGNFKVTEAIAVVSPGKDAPEVVTATPTFRWKDDSSETGYQVKVYDDLGKLVWEKLDVPSVTGSKDVEVTYAGPALTSGRYYQFRATSMKTTNPIARTEELRGVFVVQ